MRRPGGGRETIICPAAEEVIAEVPDASEEAVDRAVQAAARAFEDWFDTTPGERSWTLLRLAELAGDIFPPGVLNIITGHGQPAGAALVQHPDAATASLSDDADLDMSERSIIRKEPAKPAVKPE